MTSRSAARAGRLPRPSGAPERGAPLTVLDASRRLRASLEASGFEVLGEVRLPRLPRVDAAPGASGRSVRFEFAPAGLAEGSGAPHAVHVFEYAADGRWAVARSSVHEDGRTAEVAEWGRTGAPLEDPRSLRWSIGYEYHAVVHGTSVAPAAPFPVATPTSEYALVDRYGSSAARVLARFPHLVARSRYVGNDGVARAASAVARALAVEPLHTRSGADSFVARALAAGLSHPSDAVDVARVGLLVLDDAAPERLARGLALLDGLADGVPLTWLARRLSTG